jgi:hypothetical protein
MKGQLVNTLFQAESTSWPSSDSPADTVAPRSHRRLLGAHVRLSEGAVVQSLGNRLRDTEHSISTASRPLAYPLRHAGFVLNDLTDELRGEVPHARQLRNGEVALLERFTSLLWIHDP